VTSIGMLFCFSMQNFTETGKLAAELWPKTILKWRPSAILNFMGPIMGSLKSPCRTSYWSSIETTALDCWVLRKSRFVRILATYGEMDGQTDEPIA